MGSLGDLAGIARIGAESHGAPQWSPAQYRELIAGQPGSALRRAVLLGQREGAIAGFAVVSALCSVRPPEAELESIAVAPQHREHGVGCALLKAVIAWAAEMQAGCLYLEVRAGNTRALQLYVAAGFLPSGTRTGYYAGPVEDAVCMRLTMAG